MFTRGLVFVEHANLYPVVRHNYESIDLLADCSEYFVDLFVNASEVFLPVRIRVSCGVEDVGVDADYRK